MITNASATPDSPLHPRDSVFMTHPCSTTDACPGYGREWRCGNHCGRRQAFRELVIGPSRLVLRLSSVVVSARVSVAIVLAALLGMNATVTAAAPETATHYHVTGRIRGPDALWDYASVDGESRRLFIGGQGGVLALDLDNPTPMPTRFFDAPVVHQVLPIGKGHLLATTGESDILVILQDGEPTTIARVPVGGHDTDTVAFDSKMGLAVTFNRGSRDATLIDVAGARAIARLPLPGAPEFPVSDGHGTVYVNITDKAQVAVLDLARKRIIRTINLDGCKEPTGLALDAPTKLLISTCQNGVAKVVTTDGEERASVTIGQAPDAAFIDAQRRLAFIPSGESGTLSVISLVDPNKITLLQTVKTQHGARTGAVDPQTGTVYLPTGRVKAPVPPAKWPSVVPGTFEILVISP